MTTTVNAAPISSRITWIGCSILLLALLVFLANGQKDNNADDFSRDDSSSWSDDAYWIWGGTQEEEKDGPFTTHGNTWMVFRKTIEFKQHGDSAASPPRRFKGKIAVDSKYWLWMSQKESACNPREEEETGFSFSSDEDTMLVVREGGLKRGPTPKDTWYDLVDVQIPKQEECLNNVSTSNNTTTTQIISIQVLVWYWGKNGFSHKDSGQGGLILDGTIIDDSNDVNVVVAKVVSDSSWWVQPHPAFVSHPNEAPNLQKWTPNYRLSEYNIYYDAQKETSFNNDNWRPAKTLGTAGSPPWNQLVPRTIPPFKYYKPMDYKHVDYYYSVDDNNNNTIIIIQARLYNNTQFLPCIEFASPETPAGLLVEIQTDNYFYKYHSDTTLNNNGRPPWKKKTPYYLRTTYISRSGRQIFESPAWINGHVVTYRIYHPVNHDVSHHALLEPQRDIQVQYRPTRYDTRLVGHFRTQNDGFYNILWNKARRTLLVNMRDNFMDCPDRERAQWWGDLTVDIGQVSYSLDHFAWELVKKAIFDLVQWQQHPSWWGLCNKLHAPVPAGAYAAELPAQMLASIGRYGIYKYYEYTGDSATIRQAYPHVSSYLRTCWSLHAKTGLINHRRGDWDWMDWGDNADTAVMDNAWYVLALRAAIPMAKIAGQMADVDLWKQQLSSIEANFDVTFWNNNDGANAYMSPAQRGLHRPPDDRANALAVLADLVPDYEDDDGQQQRWPGIANVLTSQFWASPYMEYYVLEAMFKMNQTDAALQRMKTRYKDMVAATNITTLWEQWDLPSGTYNHAWSGGPLTVLSKYVAGIAPTSPGWKTFHVLPQLGKDLTHVEAAVPVFLKGKDDVIKVSIEKMELDKECLYKIELTVPAASTATVGIPKSINFTAKPCSLRMLSIDDVTVWIRGSGRISPELLDSRLLFDGDEGDYVKWSTTPGIWRFEGRGDCGSTFKALA